MRGTGNNRIRMNSTAKRKVEKNKEEIAETVEIRS